ncbi:MAG: TerC family protein, partial [Actinomycetes bacterium]
MEWMTNPDVWSALATLLFLEVVLGVDNVIFISILAGKLPAEQQDRARRTGLLAAGGMRIVLLMAVGWIITLKKDLFEVAGVGFSGKDLILLAGGLFLLWKATNEIHHKLEGEEGHASAKVAPTFAAVIAQVMLLDLVFSIDSVITAVGMTEYVAVMVAAVVVSIVIMLFASKSIYGFVNQHPTVKMLALAFLMLIGVTLLAEGFGQK